MKTFKCKCKYCGIGWSFTGFCKPKFCSDQCNANYQKKEVKMKLTLKQLIEDIKNRKEYALKQTKRNHISNLLGWILRCSRRVIGVYRG